MTRVGVFRPGVFPGWPAFNDRINRIPAAELAMILARCVVGDANQHDGVFEGNEDHNGANHHLMQRILLERWRAEHWRTPDPTRDSQVLDAEAEVSALLRALLDLRQQHDALTPPLIIPLWMKIGRSLWFTALEQRFSSRATKLELARASILYRTVWPALEEAEKVTVPGPSRTAFDALEYILLLVVLLWKNNGYVPDARTALAQADLSEGQIDTLLEVYTVPAADLLDRIPSPQDYPGLGFANSFIEWPILRVNESTLFAPQPTCMYSGFEFRVLQQALTAGVEGAADPETGFGEVSQAFGHVFEAYVSWLLSAAELDQGGETVLEEFDYQRNEDTVASPDAFVLGGETALILECKALRYPFDIDQATHLSDLREWLGKLGGATDERGPFDQGAAFFDDLNNGRCAPQLPGVQPANCIYLIVSYEEIPAVANWRQFRTQFWSDGLSDPARGLLFERTLFVSVRDLEIALTVLRHLREVGTPLQMGSAVKGWQQWLQEGEPAWEDAQGRHFRGGLGSYLLELHPEAKCAPVLPALRSAFEDLFVQTANVAFGPTG